MIHAPRLPGVRFEVETPAVDQTLPRMDIAVFVGFAARGPLHSPVVLEDVAQFEAIFGSELLLAWDATQAHYTRAHLGPTVRAFFRNGGRRCWAVRVADETKAEANRFTLPGLRLRRPEGRRLESVVVQANSPGSWSDRLEVATALQVQTLRLLGLEKKGARLHLHLEPNLADAIEVGELLRLRSLADPAGSPGSASRAESGVLLIVQAAGVDQKPGAVSGVPIPRRTLIVETQTVAWFQGTNPGKLRLSAPRPAPTFAAGARLERLRLELRVRAGDATPLRLPDLGFHPKHPRYLGHLPDDDRLYGLPSPFGTRLDETAQAVRDGLWAQVRALRFPLAGDPSLQAGFVLPLDLDTDRETYAIADNSAKTALERDGLDVFGSELFLDARLDDAGPESLIAEAEFLRYQDEPQRLRGIHAAIALDEATLIAVPDAVHEGWDKDQPDIPRDLEPGSTHESPPDPSARPLFASCRSVTFTAPQLKLQDSPPPDTAHYVVLWTAAVLEGASPEDGIGYVLEASTHPEFVGAISHSGKELEFQVENPSPGISYYRVRAQWGEYCSPWSNRLTIEVPLPKSWRVLGRAGQPEVLSAVHQSLLRLGAARGDLFAALSLPSHYREDETLDYSRRLRGTTAARTLSYGALYHPWPLAGRDEGFRAMPPDGSACGVLARRALERGAWVAPANQLLNGVVALAPRLQEARRLDLQEARVNVLRQEARGFMTLSASTLSTEPDLAPIGVRRLLMLLRRLALREGSHYVFEPLNDAFRRQVERAFNAFLGQMFARGAFVGRSPEQAYRVVVDDTVNPVRSLDAGRFVVELRVAPSLPMRFLTVRLVQLGDRGLVIEEGV